MAFRVVDPASQPQAPVITGSQGGSPLTDPLGTVLGIEVTPGKLILGLGALWALKALKIIK